MLLRGIQQSATSRPPPKLPITKEVLQSLVKIICGGYFTPYKDAFLKAMFISAYCRFLRCGEITSRTQAFVPSSDLQVIRSSEGTAVSRIWFCENLRTALQHAGFPPDNYSGHSFRIGAATSSASRNISPHLITSLG
ncbi:hypothetical protein EOD39_15212 [Acipenser ruthenus]|uniref:Tyr recombinase domain-containing protein n=1 Tax=Acipenser ruthenus TaxID=7906 RepID=A0A662YKW0_ACIRT|nr:hypothetical protein EOD39_15212 [Acipenser ruthenus]